MIKFALLGNLAVAAGRVTTSFNDGWLFSPSEGTWACSTPSTAAEFSVDLTGVQLQGMNQGTGSTADECRASCGCTCQAWQFCDTTNPSLPCASWGGCWIGNLQSLGPSNLVTNGTGWVGGGRLSPPTPPLQTFGPASLGFDTSGFELITLPHDALAGGIPLYSADTTLQRHGYIPFTNGWAIKNFTVPANADMVRVNFGGCYRSCTVFINSAFAGHHESGYTSFSVWLHNATVPLALGSVNTIAVHIDGTTFQEGWFYEGTGLYRTADLIVYFSPVSIAPDGVFVPSTITGAVNAPAGSGGSQTADAIVAPRIDVSNDGGVSIAYSLVNTIFSSTGEVVAAATLNGTLSPKSWVRLATSVPIASAQLWFPASSPSDPDRPLYTLVTTLMQCNSNGTTTYDAVNTSFGIRLAVFDPNKGLTINGFPVLIRGLSMHSDFGGCGTAVPRNIIAYRVQRLLEMGGNGWRTAHAPVDPHVLEETDRRGVMVWAENRFLRMFEQSVQECQDMVLRDRNHPSILLISLCNENGCLEDPGYEGAPAGSVAGAIVAQTYKDAIYSVDGTRPVTANTHAMIDQEGTILDALDILGVTYDYSAYDTLHVYRPFAAVIGGESASCVSDRGFYAADNDTAGYVSSYSPLGCTGPSWLAVTTRAWIAGNFAWAGADYAGESEWPAVSSHYGIIDSSGFPKPSYYWYYAWWGKDAGHVNASSRVYAFPDWTLPGQEGSTVSVVAYAAGTSVALYVNGAQLGPAQPMPAYGYVQWPAVKYTPGNLTVVSLDASGAVLGTYTSLTAGPPSALVVTLDWPGSGPGGAIRADGADTCLVRVSVVDAAGRVVPTANHNITFSVQGPGSVYGVGSGDPACHTSSKSSWRAAYVGLARAVIQAGTTQGLARVTASAEGLEPGFVDVSVYN